MGKNIWQIEEIEMGLKRFKEENGHYPTATEFESCEYLPTARQMQRRFGGMVKLRELLKIEGPSDLTKGEYSSNRARTIGKRAHIHEKEVHSLLVKRFGKPFVHREYLFDEDKRFRTDFFVYTKEGGFAVDVFYPMDYHSLKGCLNSKLRTYEGVPELGYPIIFLMMNEEIGDADLAKAVDQKVKKMKSNYMLMGIERMKVFCQGHTAYSIT